MALESFCAACTYLDECSNYDGKYFCERKGEYLYACDAKCYNFCEAYSRSNSSRENMYENSRSHISSGCYITTIMCKLLGMNDNNYYLQTLRNFRNRMKTNINDLPLLVLYDQIGPMIAEAIENDENGEQIAYTLFKRYIVPAVSAIEESQDNTAKDIYIAMTYALGERYNIDTQIVIPDKNDIDYEALGHGKVRIRKPQTNY